MTLTGNSCPPYPLPPQDLFLCFTLLYYYMLHDYYTQCLGIHSRKRGRKRFFFLFWKMHGTLNQHALILYPIKLLLLYFVYIVSHHRSIYGQDFWRFTNYHQHPSSLFLDEFRIHFKRDEQRAGECADDVANGRWRHQADHIECAKHY